LKGDGKVVRTKENKWRISDGVLGEVRKELDRLSSKL
jgi:hypothetical protein